MQKSPDIRGVFQSPPSGVGGSSGGEGFLFEADFIEDNIRCIPMIARFKLDACGIKLKLKEWSKMTVEERTALAASDCGTTEALLMYKATVQAIILNRTGETATEMEVDTNPQWAETIAVPAIVADKCKELNIKLTLMAWQQLHYLQRFVLVKLARPSHENRNFPLAMKEFGLV